MNGEPAHWNTLQVHTTVLLIEDHDDIREGLQELLRREGYAVEVAGNGREALNKLHHGLRPSVIVTDLMMPVMGGFEFRQEQLSHPRFRDIPLIVYSGATDPRSEAQQLRAAGYLAKPIDMDGLIQMVRQHCPSPTTAAGRERAALRT